MRFKKNSLNSLILLSIEKTIDGFVRLDDFINNPKQYALGLDRHLRKSDISYAVKRLRERGFVETKINEGEVIIRLTELGNEFIPIKEEEWDGKWRIVVYDIPEDKRVIRNLFRRRLRDWQFRKLQQSIWITKLNITDKMRRLISRLKIESWVVVIESDDPTLSTITGRPH